MFPHPCVRAALPALLAALLAAPLFAQSEHGGEANLVLPDLNSVTFLGGITGHNLLMVGLAASALGMIFGLIIYTRLKNMPVHKSMLEVSELIYETCKTYLQTQGKFLLILECFIGAIIVFYFGFLCRDCRRSRSSSSCSSAWWESPAVIRWQPSACA